MENLGRPVNDLGGTDHMEVERRYQMEGPQDVNYKLGQADPNDPMNNNPFAGQAENVGEANKMPYIKGEVYILL